jgi:bifunctional UDP-N-acetylglucosamine pyrophosphorylase/glucosamine-1-phosphate N-acetyltransferase
MASPDSAPKPLAVILAAGLGTRMRSSMAKVLHPLCGRPMVAWVAAAAQQAGCDVAAVVHHQEDAVRAALPGVPCARQHEPRGTGDAVQAAIDLLPASGTVLVLPGDAPLIRPAMLRALLEGHGDALCTVLSTVVSQPGAYGRIVRDDGRVVGIVEASEATPAQLAITEVNAGVYAFEAAWLRDVVLPSLQPHPPKGEYYITDAVALAAAAGRLNATCLDDAASLAGINDRTALARFEDVLQERILAEHSDAGVTLHRPGTIRVEVGVCIGQDAVLEPGVVLAGDTCIGVGARIGAYTVLRDTVVAAGAVVKAHSVLEGAQVGADAQVGPFSHLRPGAVLGERCRVGNFVEIKKSTLAAGVKASHLSYLGDATIGEGTNVGAGTITCNYDGYGKHPTIIGRDVFIGSNTALVAPLTVGDGALLGAGSTITAFVPDHALAIGRARQVTFPEGSRTLREQFRDRAKAMRQAAQKLPDTEDGDGGQER